MSKTATVQTNLLGRRAKLTFRKTDEEIAAHQKRTFDPPAWQYLGAEGEIVLVTMKDAEPYISIREDNGNVVESWLSHFRVLEEKPNITSVDFQTAIGGHLAHLTLYGEVGTTSVGPGYQLVIKNPDGTEEVHDYTGE